MAIQKLYPGVIEPLVNPGCIIVDVGCGDAEFWANMQSRGRAIWAKLVGIDIDILKVSAAVNRNIKNCDIMAGDAFKALKKFGSDSSDLTVCIDALDHMSPPSHPQKAQAILISMKRITKKESGRLVLAFQTYEAGVAMQRFGNYEIIEQTSEVIKVHIQSVMYLTSYTEAYARKLLQHVGLEILQFKEHRLTAKELKEKYPTLPDTEIEVYSKIPIDYVFVCRKK